MKSHTHRNQRATVLKTRHNVKKVIDVVPDTSGDKLRNRLETPLGLLRFAQFRFGAILGKEFPDIPAHDLVTGRAQMNMIIYKKVQDRFTVLPEHVVKDVDIICLGLGFEEISHQLIKFEDVR